jgi:type IV pilus assembly protein PilV
MNFLTRHPRPHAARREAGVMLLETLIAILIFSFGVLGIVALQAQSIRHVNEAQYRGEAIYLANSLVGRMWAGNQKTLGTDYAGDKGTGGTGYMAFVDSVSRLPGANDNAPTVTVAAGPSTTSSNVTVTIRWQLPGDTVVHNYQTTAVVGQQE